jgi:Leucine-rich repeat (LRR) protein
VFIATISQKPKNLKVTVPKNFKNIKKIKIQCPLVSQKISNLYKKQIKQNLVSFGEKTNKKHGCTVKFFISV